MAQSFFSVIFPTFFHWDLFIVWWGVGTMCFWQSCSVYVPSLLFAIKPRIICFFCLSIVVFLPWFFTSFINPQANHCYCIKAWKTKCITLFRAICFWTTVVSPSLKVMKIERVLLTYFNFVLHVNPGEVLTIGIPVPHTEWFICRLRESSSQNPVTSWRVTIGTWHSSLIA